MAAMTGRNKNGKNKKYELSEQISRVTSAKESLDVCFQGTQHSALSTQQREPSRDGVSIYVILIVAQPICCSLGEVLWL